MARRDELLLAAKRLALELRGLDLLAGHVQVGQRVGPQSGVRSLLATCNLGSAGGVLSSSSCLPQFCCTPPHFNYCSR